MRCQADIQGLANDRFEDAECLFNGGRFDAAYYMAGYTVELLIKSRVCKTLGIDNLFDMDNANKVKFHGEIIRPFRVHKLEQLLVLSGIYTDFKAHLLGDNDFRIAWSIIEAWSEETRYLTGKSKTDAEDLLTSIKKFGQWIQLYL